MFSDEKCFAKKSGYSIRLSQELIKDWHPTTVDFSVDWRKLTLIISKGDKYLVSYRDSGAFICVRELIKTLKLPNERMKARRVGDNIEIYPDCVIDERKNEFVTFRKQSISINHCLTAQLDEDITMFDILVCDKYLIIKKGSMFPITWSSDGLRMIVNSKELISLLGIKGRLPAHVVDGNIIVVELGER